MHKNKEVDEIYKKTKEVDRKIKKLKVEDLLIERDENGNIKPIEYTLDDGSIIDVVPLSYFEMKKYSQRIEEHKNTEEEINIELEMIKKCIPLFKDIALVDMKNINARYAQQFINAIIEVSNRESFQKE